MTRRILSWYIWSCTALVLTIQGLSLVHGIDVWPLVAIAATTLCGAALVMKPNVHIRPRFSMQALRPLMHPLLLPLTIALPIMVVILFALGWHVPANNWDSMTYHLSRAAYWRQWHTLAHFPSYYWAQNANPGNAEVLLLVTLLVAHSPKFAFIVQFSAYLVAALAVYGLGRKLGLRVSFAFLGAGLFATMPEVVLQATSTQNDLIAAAFTLCAVYFLVDATQRRSSSSLMVGGAALGLAIGAKPTAFFALPGLAVGAGIMLWPHRHVIQVTKRGYSRAATAVFLAILLGAPWYVADKMDYGSFSGPPDVSAIEQVSHPSLGTLRVNVVRYLIGFIDPEGPALLSPSSAANVCSRVATIRAQLVGAAGIPSSEPAVEWAGVPYSSAPTCGFNEDVTWFGFVGWLAAVVSLAIVIVGAARRKVGLSWMLAAGMTSFILCMSWLLRWSPWQQRLLITSVGLGAPLLALAAQRLWERPVRLWRPVLQLGVMYAALTGLSAAIDNSAKPISAWGMSSAAMQVVMRPEMGPILKRVAQSIPAQARVGTFLQADDWDFPLFGPHLDRTVEPLVLSRDTPRYSVRPSTLDAVLTDQSDTAVQTLFHKVDLHTCRLTWTVESWRLYQCTPETRS